VRDFLQALSFLTILPLGRGLSPEEKSLGRSMAFFPLVGLVIGLLLASGDYLLSFLFPKPIVLWLTIGLLAFLTGGLHLDGFADMMDGLGSRGSREKMLEVMRDSRIGAFGVIGLILLIGAKYLALAQIPGPSLPHSLVLTAVMGRNSMVLVCYRSPYARPGTGLARPFSENMGSREMLLSSAWALAVAFLFPGFRGLIAFLGVGLFSLLYRFYFMRRMGGVTGDILGASNELAEVLCLFLLIV
jgi:adenosylcobinamide-GDP ribazoletransferase